MKKLKVSVAAVIVVIITAVIIRINMDSTAEQKIVKEDLVTSNVLVQNKLHAILQEEENGIPKPARGTKENPFIVVEIVPHECLGQFGYLIPGCEPIDIEQLKKNDTLFMNGYGNMLCVDEPHVVELSQTKSYLTPDEVPLGATISQYGGWGFDQYMASAENYKVDPENAEWKQSWELREFEGYYELTKDQSGGFKLVQNGEQYTFEWVKSGGDYKWVTEENVHGTATDYTQSKVWTTRNSYAYYKTHNSVTHSDELVRNVFGTTSDKIYKEVVVVTPDLFLEDKNLDLIKCADMLYIHAGDSSGQAVPLWANFNKKGRGFVDKNGNPLDQGSAAGMGFNENDLPWDAVLEIMNRMSAEERPALIMDNNTASLQHNNNLYKLLLMIRLYGPKMFKELFLDTGRVEEVAVGDDWTTGAVTKYGQQKTSWEYTDLYPEGHENDTEEQLAAYGVKCTNFLTNDADNESRWNMVEDNMYFYLGGQAFLRGFLNSDQYGVDQTKYTEEVYDYLEEYRDYTPDKVSPANIVEYLLQNTPTKRKLRILEVEPCNEFIYGSENWKAYYLSLLPWFGGDINDKEDLEVVTMPTWEFNSSIDDLNSEYDMIIFGAKQNESNGLNGYNDPLINVDLKDQNGNPLLDYSTWPPTKKQIGLAYTSIGDLVASTEYYGQQNEVTVLIKPDDSTRYSGTDITEKKLKELQSFMNGGKPIVLDTKLANVVKTQGAALEKKTVDMNRPVNTEVIDQSSYMNRLVDLYKKQNMASPAMFVKNYYVAAKLKKALAYENCRIEFVPVSDKDPGYPTEYSYTEDADQCIAKDKVQYASRMFRYTFQIVGKTMASYGVHLFIDTNSDGIYKGSLKEMEEGVQGLSEKVTGFTVTDLQGNVVNPNNLTANVTYVLTKKLDETYQGIMPWKLEAFKMAEDSDGNMTKVNTSCRSSRMNYAAIQAEKPKEIRVLLMDVTPNMMDPEEYYSQPGIDQIWWVAGDDNHPSSITNMVDTSTGTGQKFDKYLNCVKEFDVELIWLDNSEWKKCFDSSTGDASAWIDYLNNGDVEHKTKTDKDDAGGFDMIILGFSDDCTYTDNEVFHKGFIDFINQGKGVILSHDMVRDTSQTKYLKTRYDNELRDLMGQRRYGADRVVLNEEGTAGTYLNGQWVTLMHEDVSDPDHKASDAGGYYDLSAIGTTKDGTTVKLPGFFDNANRLYLCYGDEDAKNDRVSDVKSDWPTLTNYANNINHAQITSYPYAIPELLDIAYTHAQNYQLDLETDVSAGDVVVWYGLTDSKSKLNGGDARGLYSSIESDGRNNFYIYNKGNITYTGLGHSKEMTDIEVKLFVNTMISAYRSTAPLAEVVITNEEAVRSGGNTILYVNTDEENPETNKDLVVNFRIDEQSIGITGRNYLLEYQHKKKDETGRDVLNQNGQAVYELELIDTVVVQDGNGQPGSLAQRNGNGTIVYKDGTYYFTVPYDTIKRDGVAEYNLILYSIENGVAKAKTTHLTIMQTPLFALN